MRVQDFVGETCKKSPLRRPKRGWENNIKVGFHEVGFWVLDWIELARIVTRGEHF
jgi:hypothetical protein